MTRIVKPGRIWRRATADQLTAYERQFRRAGLPLFVEDFSASTDVFNRAAPLLGLIFVGELLGVGQFGCLARPAAWSGRPGWTARRFAARSASTSGSCCSSARPSRC